MIRRSCQAWVGGLQCKKEILRKWRGLRKTKVCHMLLDAIEDSNSNAYLKLRLLGHGIVTQINGLGLGLGCVPTP